MSDSLETLPAVPSISRPWVWLVLSLVFAVAIGVRSLDASSVFLSDGTVVLAFDDASYHARLVHDGVSHFPHLLTFDALLNHPIGARVPWPPLYDWLLAFVGWILGGAPATVDQVLAWASPLFGSLAVFPVFLGARALMGIGPALCAAAALALLPIAVLYSRVGNPDHHAWLVLLAASYLALSLRQVAQPVRGRIRMALGLIVVRVFVTLSWSGSLLYLVIGESALLIVALVRADREALGLQALGCGAAGLMVAPVVALSPAPLGGWLSASALSGLHVLFFAGVSTLSAGLRALESLRPSRGWGEALARAAGLVLTAGALALLLPQVRKGVAPAMAYLSTTGGFFGNPEQFPLYAWMRHGIGRQLAGSTAYYGGFAYLLPLPLLASAWAARHPRRRAPALILFVWTLPLSLLAVVQLRWGNDLAPAAVTGFAMALSLALEGVTAWTPKRQLTLRIAVVGFAGLLLFSVGVEHYPKLRAHLAGANAGHDVEVNVPTVQLVRFAQKVREVARDHADPRAGESRPTCAILASPRYGHVLHYVARCATPADNFGPQLSRERYRDVLTFLYTRRESKAVSIARANATRYVMTERPWTQNRALVAVRLHANDGSASPGHRALGHFRLLDEAEPGAVGLLGVRGADAPYKLFEVVEGALLEVEATPGSRVTAELLVRTPGGREFRWRTSARATHDGRATLRVPYASDSQTGSGGVGPYRVSFDGTVESVSVEEDEVLTGAVVSLYHNPQTPPPAGPEPSP